MKFSMGLSDALFGKKLTVEVPQEDGTVRRIQVTEKWLRDAEASGKLVPVQAAPTVTTVHVVSPYGLRDIEFVVGEDIPEDRYEQLVDRETNALYALEVFRDGVPEMTIVRRDFWKKACEAMGQG
ncbi:MAG TPA: hypothetical protein VHA35_15760 [Dongiaceae bacterium]|nr:hypothetical protein [Dongiaceae bacterium]